MKIASSTVNMSSQHSLTEESVEQETLRFWTGNAQPEINTGQGLAIVSISEQAKALYAGHVSTNGLAESNETVSLGLSEKDKQKIQLLQTLLEKLTGRKIKIRAPEIQIKKETIKPLPMQIIQPVRTGRPSVGWGLSYDLFRSHFEEERLLFNADGMIKTADGREIEFSVNLSMTRSFASRENISIRAGDALIDPLVINFDAPAASLTTDKFSFDIDSDGRAEQISFTGPGSGFLALDLNGDGMVNNGQELFGPNSGDGFAELAGYDSDGNNWIDENDEIYHQLRIWTKDDQGNYRLFALGQKGIGAIYLGNIATGFELKDNSNSLHGQINSTGIFLKENGSVGTVQHVDLAI